MKKIYSRNRNHPPKGSSCKVDPIRKREHIYEIKNNLIFQPRNLFIFTLGINTNLRASDILRIKYRDVLGISLGESFTIKEKKTGKNRVVTINKASFEALQGYLAVRSPTDENAPLFLRRGSKRKSITVSHLNRLLKKWCRAIPDLKGNFGSHTLRKTFGLQHRLQGTSIPVLMVAFNHSTERQTLAYLGVSNEEIQTIYMKDI